MVWVWHSHALGGVQHEVNGDLSVIGDALEEIGGVIKAYAEFTGVGSGLIHVGILEIGYEGFNHGGFIIKHCGEIEFRLNVSRTISNLSRPGLSSSGRVCHHDASDISNIFSGAQNFKAEFHAIVISWGIR